jgi:Na+-driven multidrug efflux pump
MTRQIIFLIPLVILFPIFMGVEGVMYAGPIADGAAGVLALVLVTRELGKLKGEA